LIERLEAEMKKLNSALIIGGMVLLFTAAGIGILTVRIQADNGRIEAYNDYIVSAREKAQKGINFYAKNDYLSAFSIYNKDQELFLEFLDFLKDTEDASYVSYLKTYMKSYPEDVEPYQILCKMYYDDKRYRDVQTLLLEAQAAGVSSDLLAEYYDLTLYEFTFLSGGYHDISKFYGEQAIVDKDGKKGLYYYRNGLLIPAEYDELSYYINGAVVAQKSGECFFVDFNGNKSGVPSEKVESLSILSNGCCAVSVGGKYGYMDSSLNVPKELPYEYATAFSEGIAAVKVNGKWGLIDLQQQYLVTPQYEEILLTEFGTCVSSGVVFARRADGYVMLNTAGEQLNEYVFEEVQPFGLSGQPAAVKLDGQWTFVKTTGELFPVGTELAGAKSFDNMLAPVTLDGETWGYMDGYGKIVIEPQFDDCRQFSVYGVAPVKRGEVWSMIQLLRYQN